MESCTLSLVFLLSSYQFRTGSFNTSITLAAFPILILISSCILPSLADHYPQILHYLHRFEPPVPNFHITMSSILFHLHHFCLLTIHFHLHLVNVSSNFCKFTCKASALSAINIMSSAKSRTSAFSSLNITPSMNP